MAKRKKTLAQKIQVDGKKPVVSKYQERKLRRFDPVESA